MTQQLSYKVYMYFTFQIHTLIFTFNTCITRRKPEVPRWCGPHCIIDVSSQRILFQLALRGWDFVWDVLRIGDLELSGQFFGEATDTSRENPSAKFDGFFGLGFDATSQALVETPLHHMMRQGALDRKMFSVYIGRNRNPGELMLEGYDSNWFKGELIYMDTASQLPGIRRMSISDGTAVTTSTMAVFVFGPSERKARRQRGIPGSGVYSIDCAADPPDVTFVVDGHPFSISKVDYICQLWTRNVCWLLLEEYRRGFWALRSCASSTLCLTWTAKRLGLG
ncbi:Peptidase family A1 domain [Phytophthora cactorum]|nr:Peptidase family A1 domain [Phytophthora cactorum]